MRAAGIILVATLVPLAAAAAERPRPASHAAARSCPQYGPGFVEVPGTATCIRISGRVRADYVVTSGRRTISRDQIQGFGPSGSIAADVRTQTEMGPLRTYVRTRAGGGLYGGR